MSGRIYSGGDPGSGGPFDRVGPPTETYPPFIAAASDDVLHGVIGELSKHHWPYGAESLLASAGGRGGMIARLAPQGGLDDHELDSWCEVGLEAAPGDMDRFAGAFYHLVQRLVALEVAKDSGLAFAPDMAKRLAVVTGLCIIGLDDTSKDVDTTTYTPPLPHDAVKTLYIAAHTLETQQRRGPLLHALFACLADVALRNAPYECEQQYPIVRVINRAVDDRPELIPDRETIDQILEQTDRNVLTAPAPPSTLRHSLRWLRDRFSQRAKPSQ